MQLWDNSKLVLSVCISSLIPCEQTSSNNYKNLYENRRELGARKVMFASLILVKAMAD